MNQYLTDQQIDDLLIYADPSEYLPDFFLPNGELVIEFRRFVHAIQKLSFDKIDMLEKECAALREQLNEAKL